MNRITLNKNNKNQDVVSIYKKKFFNKESNKEEVVDNHLVANELGFNNFNSDFKLNFLNPSSLSNDIVSLVKDDYKVVFKLIGKKENNLTQLNKIKARLINDYKVIYEDIFTDSSIEYEILNDKKIKENIIIKNNNKNEYVYEYEIEINNLQVKLSDDGNELLFVNKDNEAIFKMLSPIMNDANNNTSEDITYTINKIDDKYQLLINASASWINSSERALPIYIDPTIEVLAVNSNEFVNWYILNNYKQLTSFTSLGRITNSLEFITCIVNKEIINGYNDFLIKLTNRCFKNYEFPIRIYCFKQSEVLQNNSQLMTNKTFSELKTDAPYFDVKVKRILGQETLTISFYKQMIDGYDMFIFDRNENTTYMEITSETTSYILSKLYNNVTNSYNNPITLTNNITFTKNLIDKRFSLNINEMDSIGNLSLSHHYSKDDVLSSIDRSFFFYQYGSNYRINYSLIVMASEYVSTDNLLRNLKLHTYTLIDSTGGYKNFIKKDYKEEKYYLESDEDTVLTIEGNNLFIENKTSKMTFVHYSVANSEAYLLKEMKSLVNDDKVTIYYQENQKSYIDAIADNKGNQMMFFYNADHLLSEVQINDNILFSYLYDEDDNMYRISKDSVSLYAEFDYFKHPKELIKITDYNNNKFTIDTNEFSITNTSFNENKIICKIDYFSNKTVISDEKDNKQCYLFDDNQELISSYTLKPDSTDTTVIYADNVPYFHKKEEKKVEISKITTISTAESGTLNLKGVNLIDFKKIHFGNKYAQGTLNHFTIFKMFTHNEFSCNIDTSKLRKGYNYTFGLFVKNNSRTKDCKLTLKALINNEESNLTKEITYVPYDDFYLVTLTLHYFSKVNITINSLVMKFKLESSDENCEFYFSYPIFSKDDSYTLTSTTIEYSTNGIEKYSSLKLNQNICQVDTYDGSRKVITSSSKCDFNKIPFDNILTLSNSFIDEINNLTFYKTAYEYNDLKQVTKASNYENDVLKNEVLYNYDGKGNLISKVTKDSNNVTNEIKYEYNYEENTQKLYNDNNELVLTKEFDSENKLISDKYNSLDKKYYSYNNYNSLTKINTNNYFCNFTYNKDDITNITANNRTTYKYEYNNKNQLSKVKLVDFTNSSNYLQLYSFTYNDDNIPYKIVKGNNVFTKEYIYNDDLLIQSIKENNETVTTFEYNEHDSIKKITHKASPSKTLNKDYSYWEYDGSLWKIDYSGFLDYSIYFALYDFDNCEAAKMIKFTNTATDYTYKYEDNISNKLIEVAYYTIKHSITYDLFNNVSSVKTTNEDNNVSITYDFAYKTNSNKITSFVKDVT